MKTFNSYMLAMLFRMTNLIFFIYSSCQSPNALHEPLRVCVALSAHLRFKEKSLESRDFEKVDIWVNIQIP